TTINGTLQFSTSQHSQLIEVGGNTYVQPGGTLTLGTAAAPIPAGTTAQLVLSSGTYAGQYGLTIADGGNFVVYGTTKTPSTTATANVTGTHADVTTPVTGWSVGDIITVDTEAVTITAISAGSIDFTPAVGHTHYASTPTIVAVLSHNAVV